MESSTLSLSILGLASGFCFIKYQLKEKIKRLGTIKCNKCGYQGLAKASIVALIPELVCPDCNSKAWETLPE
ncbi:MAG: hypothetical protein KAR45_20235 [Desulfobacteraceae bacterium]|nr:hypothetical protein [Desulfobacteraceae bacterium]